MTAVNMLWRRWLIEETCQYEELRHRNGYVRMPGVSWSGSLRPQTSLSQSRAMHAVIS